MKDLMRLAECDMKLCKELEPSLPDEFAMRGVAYHVQQAIEKLLKAYIIFYGGEVKFTHDIGFLCSQCLSLGVSLPDELLDISDTLTLWEAKTRYDPYVSASVEKYKKACNVYKCLSDNLNKEVYEYNNTEETSEDLEL